MVETRRQQIDEVASALFRERGYAGTSVREIARALDLQGASLYSHMASKEDLLWSIVLRAAERFEAVAALADGPAPAPERLRALVRAHVAVVAGEREHAAVFLHEWRFLGPERREAIERRRDDYERRVRSLIAEGVAAGAFRPVDPRLTAAAILSSLNGIATWYRASGSLAPEAVADAFADLFLAGLLPAPPPLTELSLRRNDP